LLELLEIDTLLSLLFRWSRLVGGFLGPVGKVASGIGKDISSEENYIGTDLSEFG
jgi:hypothetical protein